MLIASTARPLRYKIFLDTIGISSFNENTRKRTAAKIKCKFVYTRRTFCSTSGQVRSTVGQGMFRFVREPFPVPQLFSLCENDSFSRCWISEYALQSCKRLHRPFVRYLNRNIRINSDEIRQFPPPQAAYCQGLN